jgi:hypothetical protein
MRPRETAGSGVSEPELRDMDITPGIIRSWWKKKTDLVWMGFLFAISLYKRLLSLGSYVRMGNSMSTVLIAVKSNHCLMVAK